MPGPFGHPTAGTCSSCPIGQVDGNSGGPPKRVETSCGITSSAGEEARLSPDGKVLFFVGKQGNRYAIRSSPATTAGPQMEIATGVYANGFAPLDNGAYFVTPADGSFNVIFLDFRTRQQTQVATVAGKFGLGISVAPDRSHLVLSRLQEGQTDLMMRTNWR